MKVKNKIISGMVLVSLIGVLIGVYGFYSIHKISQLSIEQSEQQEWANSVFNILKSHLEWQQNLSNTVFTGVTFTGMLDSRACALGKWINGSGEGRIDNDTILELIRQIEEPHHQMHSNSQHVISFVEAGDLKSAQEAFSTTVIEKSAQTINILDQNLKQFQELAEQRKKQLDDFIAISVTIIAILIFLGIILSFVLSIIIIKNIMNPIRRLTKVAENVSKGNFQDNFLYEIDDEIGQLSHSFASLKDNLHLIISEMKKLSEQHGLGEIDARIDVSQFSGEFKSVTESINSMTEMYVGDVLIVLNTVQQYAEGDFSGKLKQFPGKKAIANSIVNSVSENLANVKGSVLSLSELLLEGNLSKSFDSSKFNGEWVELIEGLNQVISAVSTPLDEISDVMTEMSKGNLYAKIKGDYKGEFKGLKDTVNNTNEVICSYVEEVTDKLQKMSEGDLTIKISREYVGGFSFIKQSLNSITDTLHNTVSEILSMTDEVLSGVEIISETSITLAGSLSQQTYTIKKLTESAGQISDKTKINTQNATDANKLSSESMENAKNGDDEMRNMLTAIHDIEESSNNISKIIKVIEDIAFQTNLLALNAAVEAARAGVHGKGFSVVAEEVRSLASKSQSAAKDTTELIEDSILLVNTGIKSVEVTSKALNRIVTDINSVSDIISKTHDSSQEQSEIVSLINKELQEISQLIANDASVSDKSEDTAKLLNTQARSLREKMGFFKV